MATAAKQQNSLALRKPTLCKNCSTTHFEYTLSCKRCGEYLDKRDVVEESFDTDIGSKIMGAVGVATVVLLVCLAFRLF